MPDAPVPFPGSNPSTLGNCTGYEPSGLVLANNQLYMASDNGILAVYDTTQKAWRTVYTATNNTFSSQAEIDSNKPTKPDFESITFAKGQLMLGVEGDSSHSPQIGRFDSTQNAFTSSWLLTPPGTLSNGGMETMTFVPKEYCPAFNTSPNGPYYGGYFFTAFQSLPGYIYVYDLPQGGGKMRGNGGSPVCTYNIDITLKASDICFANGVLYVLFDGGGAEDLLAVYTTHTASNEISYQKTYGLPQMPLDTHGAPTSTSTKLDYEGLTVNGQTIYLARDSRNANTPNAVYQYINTLLYPLTTIPAMQ